MRTKDTDMLSGSITKGLLTMCLPVMLMNVLQSLFNLVDMTILETFDPGGVAVGAVGVCTSLIVLFSNLVVGISTGANVITARYIGQKQQLFADRAVGTSIALSVAAGLVLAVIGVSCAEVFLTWTNCPEALFSGAVLYFRLYFVGAPLLMIYNFSCALLRASGNSQRIMVISVAGAAVKMVTSCLLVAVFHMGIAGVAIATIISWCVYVVMSLTSLLRSSGAVKLYLQHIRFYLPELPRMLQVGVPAGIQMGLFAVANVAISSAVNTFGPQASTGVSIANVFDGLLYNICGATSLAVLPYVSQNVAAGNIKRAARSVRNGILLTIAIGGFFGALSAVFSAQLSSIMSNDPVAISYSCQKMIIISSTYFISGINDIMTATLRGMGKSIFPTVTTLIFLCGLRFAWVFWVFPLVPNLTFLYLVWPLSWICSISCSLVVYFPAKRKLELEHA